MTSATDAAIQAAPQTDDDLLESATEVKSNQVFPLLLLILLLRMVMLQR